MHRFIYNTIYILFADHSSRDFGEKLRGQVEARLHSVHVMEEALEGIRLFLAVLFV